MQGAVSLLSHTPRAMAALTQSLFLYFVLLLSLFSVVIVSLDCCFREQHTLLKHCKSLVPEHDVTLAHLFYCFSANPSLPGRPLTLCIPSADWLPWIPDLKYILLASISLPWIPDLKYILLVSISLPWVPDLKYILLASISLPWIPDLKYILLASISLPWIPDLKYILLTSISLPWIPDLKYILLASISLPLRLSTRSLSVCYLRVSNCCLRGHSFSQHGYLWFPRTSPPGH